MSSFELPPTPLSRYVEAIDGIQAQIEATLERRKIMQTYATYETSINLVKHTRDAGSASMKLGSALRASDPFYRAGVSLQLGADFLAHKPLELVGDRERLAKVDRVTVQLMRLNAYLEANEEAIIALHIVTRKPLGMPADNNAPSEVGGTFGLIAPGAALRVMAAERQPHGKRTLPVIESITLPLEDVTTVMSARSKARGKHFNKPLTRKQDSLDLPLLDDGPAGEQAVGTLDYPIDRIEISPRAPLLLLGRVAIETCFEELSDQNCDQQTVDALAGLYKGFYQNISPHK